MLYVPQIHTSINEGKDNCCVDDWLLTISLNSPVFLSSTAGVLESQDALASWVLAAHLRPDFSMENLLIKQGTVLGSNFHFSLRFRHVELCSWRDFGSLLEKMTWWHGCSASCRRWTKRKQQDVEILDFQNLWTSGNCGCKVPCMWHDLFDALGSAFWLSSAQKKCAQTTTFAQ